MILIDTNVVSGAMKPEPHPSVRDWLDAQAAETLFHSSVTVAELMFGIGTPPRGKCRGPLAAALDHAPELFDARILPFDTEAARCYAETAVRARRAERAPLPPTAPSQRLPPRTGSPWRRGTSARSRQPALP